MPDELGGDKLEAEFLIVGAGIAGLRAAIELAGAGRVLVITKEQLGESNTNYAQGGIAVAMGGDEDIHLHFEDTIGAGDGLVNQAAAEVLVEEGPQRVEELIEWGTGFDRNHGELMLTREGAHSLPRILHANGDATGAEIGRALLAHARTVPNITLAEWTTVVDLIVEDGRVAGAVVLDRGHRRVPVRARAVLLASGGAGQVYSNTTNPPVATGDGIAVALRAGADVADMEFYQFHPTALYLPGVPRFLLSEALRGEGAYLRNAKLERFMERYDPRLELAPRDVVARAITRESMSGSGDLPVYLDMRHVKTIDPVKRFPGISAFLHQQGLDLGRDLIPVRPAAHYLMGGVKTDIDGRASLPGLYAAGEAACTGVHGANRLASNSLLEGLVFGARAARRMREEPPAQLGDTTAIETRPEEHPAIEPYIARLQKGMWEHAGLLRSRELLSTPDWGEFPLAATDPCRWNRRAYEAASLSGIASVILAMALRREESRGGHFRTDFPQRDDERFQKHSVLGPKGLRYEQW